MFDLGKKVIYTYIHIYIYTHTYIYTYIYTPTMLVVLLTIKQFYQKHFPFS